MKLDDLIAGQTVEVVYTLRDGKPAKTIKGYLCNSPNLFGIAVHKHEGSDIVTIPNRDILFMRVATFENVELNSVFK